MPPPAAQTPALPNSGTDTGLDRASPPVTVTPLIETGRLARRPEGADRQHLAAAADDRRRRPGALQAARSW